MSNENVVGANLNNPIIEVKHTNLKRFDDSGYKSYCPTCEEGILFMRRDQETGHLLENDNCCFCGVDCTGTDFGFDFTNRWFGIS